jgi:hypothetical protein
MTPDNELRGALRLRFAAAPPMPDALLRDVLERVPETPQQRDVTPPILTGRLQSTFSATKFVVAGVIVALFGGFLLAGVLTQQSEESLPAVGASASVPLATRGDLLPGVGLEVEEVETGVFRVVGDGEHGLRQGVSDVAVSPEGDVWVVKSGHRLLRLGEPGSTRIESKTEVGVHAQPDGAIVLHYRAHRKIFDGERWVRWLPTREQSCEAGSSGAAVWADGACWGLHFGEGDSYSTGQRHVRADASGGERAFSPDDTGLRPGEALDQVATSSDGKVWMSVGVRPSDGGRGSFSGLIVFDGETWDRVPARAASDLPAGPNIAVDADGVVWAASLWDDRLVLERWDGEAWSSYETSDYRLGPSGHVGIQGGEGGSCCPPRLRFGEDGTIWLGGLTAFDGTSLKTLDLAASGTGQKSTAGEGELAPDGSVWVVLDEPDDEYDGLYVIAPEAWAATEQRDVE